jgi:hypothetical protein
MQENNYEYLSKQLKYTGFGEDISLPLRSKMLDDLSQFSLQHEATYGRDTAKATLQFRKSEESGMYFFNNYQLAVEKGNNTEALKQTFYINKGDENITLKEAYNLLQGRAVHKELSTREGEKYGAWIQLDFKNIDENSNFIVKKYHQNYGYDLAATLAKHPIKELADEEGRKRLMESLERGNRQSVTFTATGGEKKVFIEAVPQFKSINFYDADMKRLKPEQLQEEAPSQQKEQQQKTANKQNVDGEEGNQKGKSKSRRTGIS